MTAETDTAEDRKEVEDRKELIRVVELDYERTGQFINGVVTTGATIRGWAVTIWVAIVGIAFNRSIWELGLLAALVALVFLLLDGYHSWLIGEAQRHVNTLERVSAAYFNSLRRPDDEDRVMDLRAKLDGYRFGLYRNFKIFRFRDLLYARPRVVFRFFYPFLVGIGILAAILIAVQGPKDQTTCRVVPNSQDRAIQCGSVIIVNDGRIPQP
jgi:hypothetical protein